ncbi:magnesium transporter CorA family protein [Jidongwangia harbinensis]|uniref:magnesium transporter CorA family protein n=1 Tax=Jidongwangia harbinensis TaxID=2878561 RepID=UPI001CDA40C1|nr:magnesium transporter CorA family protein [Jidongwangia harbinensis]MCA2215950.1 magnesium transporter CorA family protein [Jidongwangia harbinensis]
MEAIPRPTRTRLYAGGKVVAEDFPAEEAGAKLREHPQAVLWLDLYDPDTADLQAIREEFGLHPLAVEDAVHDHQRPKLDRYPHHLFLNVYAIEMLGDRPEPAHRKAEVSAFVTDRALITVRKSPLDVATFTDRWDADAELDTSAGVGFLVYGLLDVVMDSQFAAVRILDEAMDRTEDELLDEGGAPVAARRYAFALRKELAVLRRAVAPMPDLLADLTRTGNHLVTERLAPYYRDVEDHARRATETIDHARDRINGVIEADLSEQSNALNDVTRKLAAWAAIIAVPTALTGYFGQNVPYPGYQKVSGFVVSLVLIVVTAGGLYWYLKRRGWL